MPIVPHKMKKPLYISAVCAGSILLSGCSFIPKLEDIKLPVPGQYPTSEAYDNSLSAPDEDTQDTLSEVSWQNFFQDETLKNLIETGLDNNRSLKQAALDIAAARARYGIERAAYLPEVTANGSYTRQQVPSSGTQGGFSQGQQSGGTVTGDSAPGPVDYYTTSVGITAYELDLFGRVRSLNEAALNDFFASRAARDSVRIALIADIASTYANLKVDQALLDLANETVKSQQDSFDLIQLRREEGVASDLELRQAETLLHQARVDKMATLRAVAQDKNALRLLLGSPDDIPQIDDQVSAATFRNFVRDVPAGMPAKLLTSRPDIIQAEYALRGANANIGAARAAFFPSLSLTGSAGYTSSEFSNLFDSSTLFWQYTPQISVPIFTAGRLRNNLDLAEIRTEQAVIDYELAIETAFREVADALAAVSTYDEQVKAQNDLVNATEQATELSQLRYDSGVEDYLTVLDARRELYAAQRQILQQKGAEINAKISLYRALGGGAYSLQE